MHLKTLTLRGFKSFASATTLEFEPGITCVVGPNGSGKSNVVDALAWVMGEQGAKTLRGGKMEDVIFAGTSTRQALGRAEVSLTIDNSDGALPIDYSEVTISRTLFRSGGSEYAINNAPARLLDIQELLSDSGLGREMHVIVGQGQLDAVLHATPEDRRGFIEEAAGVLKHRRRKEKAVRKLSGMQANLDRLADLTAELARQLGPLGRQAEAARRAQTVQIDVRDAGARLLADDLARAQAELAEGSGSKAELARRQEAAEAAHAEAQAEAARVEEEFGTRGKAVEAARDAWYRAQGAAQAIGALVTRAGERAELLSQQTDAQVRGRDPEELEAQAAQLAQTLEKEREAAGLAEAALTDAKDAKAAADAAFRAEDQRLTDVARAAADRREHLAKLKGQFDASTSRLEAAQAEAQRQADQREAARVRGEKLRAEYTTAEHEAMGVDEGEEGLDARHEAAEENAEQARRSLAGRRQEQADLEARKQALTARAEALRIGLDRSDALSSVLADDPSGVVAQVADLLDVESGYEDAIAAALGPVALGLVVEDAGAAAALFSLLRERDAAAIEVVFGSGEPQQTPAPEAALPKGSVWATQVCRVSGTGTGATAANRLVATRLTGVAIVPDASSVGPALEAGARLAVTAAGDLFATDHARGGQSGEGQILALRAAHEETLEELAALEHERQRASFALEIASTELANAESEAEAALADLHASDARIAAVAERLGRLGQSIRSASEDEERLDALAERTAAEIARHEEALAAARQRLDEAESTDVVEAEPDTAGRDELQAVAEDRAAAVMDATIALRSAEGQVDFLDKRVRSLQDAARRERRAREEAERAAEARRRQAKVAAEVAQLASTLAEKAAVVLQRAEAERAVAEESRAALEAARARIVSAVAGARTALDEVVALVHQGDVARAEVTYRFEGLAARAQEEFSLGAGDLLDSYGPHLPVPVPDGEPVAYVRAEQEKRLKRAQKDLARIGQVNPLALEEYAALEERHGYLQKQLEDVKKSRADLLGIVRDVDRHVEEVFTAAYWDTAEQFERVFARLFPGGEGRLVLTDPSDMLTTGIEVEARPAGKKVKRLSLLSGGERSLTAVALLVAIFKARPSPFYVMDEVEAALDDTNLSRLITIFEELRASSQLIVITHQKRTMEVADALYGVTMQGDGITTVISQRIPRSPDDEDAPVSADV